MSVSANLLTTLHFILQFGFIGVTLLLLLVTIVNRMRVQHVLLSWRKGPLGGLPVWPAAFLGSVIIFLALAFFAEQPVPLSIFGGYLTGGVLWMLAGWLSATVLVSDYGLVCDPNRSDQAVAWDQVVDYFECTTRNKQRYVFFYLDATDCRRRLDFVVPPAHRDVFGQIIQDRVDARFDLTMQRVYGKKELEG